MPIAAPFTAPFSLGPFMVDAEGRLSPGPERTPGFTVRWRERVLRARLEAPAGLRMQMALGRVPSSASARAGTLRPQSFALLRGLTRVLPGEWRVRLCADHSVLLETEAAVPLPITPTALVTEITCFLLAMAPYLDLLDEAGIASA
jgi:hypothetical protein